MKKIIVLAMVFISAGLKAQETTKRDTFKVWGNCEMCEERIEGAALKVKGAKSADWDAEKGVVILVYNPSLTNPEAVQRAIAGAGYDTEKIKADDNTYAKLPKCCQYKRQ
jgi:copper chaperone CopZ